MRPFFGEPIMRPLLFACTTLLATSITATCVAKPAADTFTVDHVAKLRRAGEAQISPDGRHVAWVRAVPRAPKAKGDGTPYKELHIVDRNGRSTAYVHGKTSVSHLRWTADGNSVAFLSKRNGDKKAAVWVIARDGGEAWRAAAMPAGVRAFALHPDGKSILMLSRDELAKDDKQRNDHGFNQKIVEEQDQPWQVFSHRLAAPGSMHDRPKADEASKGKASKGKASKGKASKSKTKPAPTKPVAFNLPGSASSMAISPDGKLLAVAVAPSPRIDDHYMLRKIHIVDLATRKTVGKLKRAGKLGKFWWSPDSKHLAVIGAEDEHDPRAGRLWLVDATGKLVRDLLPKYDEHVFVAAWRDATNLIYVGAKNEETDLDTVTIDGKRGKLKGFKAGIIHALSISKDGKVLAANVDSPVHPSEIFSIDASTGNAQRLTNNNPWLSKLKLAKQQAVHFKARDGLDIGGVLIRPLNEKKGKRYPLILAVHGGPESHVPNGWNTYYSRPGQVAAAKGYAVFHPNYRGSTGRGVKFSKMGQNDYAGGEFNDLVDSVKYFVGTGLVDEKKVGITGGSYGGYASAWGATKLTKHFAASVMFVGISDQISKFGTTDIPNEMFLVHSRRWPWKHWDYMRERSPIYYVEQARTPILILHGDSDPRVHPSQSMELFRYLKTIGKVPVRLVLYKGEGHGNRRASTRYDYNLRMLRWFDHYLQGKGGAKPPHRLNYGLKKSKSGAK
jgi:dipeptidyl aminopeptidase/acylaminoacyl peptidase